MPRISSARMFSSVWETSVPSTAGKLSRARPTRRATTSARAGSPRRAGSVAHISTPIAVPRNASRRRTLAHGSAARRIACHESARRTIEAAIRPKATSTQPRSEASRLRPTLSRPTRWIARTLSQAITAATASARARRATTTLPRRGFSGRRLDALEPPGRHPRQAVGGPQPDGGRGLGGERPRGAAARSRPRRPRRPRRRLRPGVARGVAGRRRRRARRGRGGRARRRAASRPARSASPRGTSRPSTPWRTTSR